MPSAPNPEFKSFIKSPTLLLGFGFGSGLIKPGPGTWGTLLGMFVFIPILLWSETFAWLILLLGLIAGSYICGKSAEILEVHDHSGIVWDEFAGIWLVIMLLPAQNGWYWLLAFVVFRFFDIVKPWPIRLADQQVPGGVGIMLDDIIAAFYSIIFIWAASTGFLMMN